MTQSLFAVYVGGVIEGCHIELHDMRFVVGETIENCFADLRAEWWGAPESLHLDAWGRLETVDGYYVRLGDAPRSGGMRLWFLNMGGYDPAQFTELHANLFVAAPDARAARKKGIDAIREWTSPHKDAVHEIETVIDVAHAAGVSLRLEPGAPASALRFEARYLPIGKRA